MVLFVIAPICTPAREQNKASKRHVGAEGPFALAIDVEATVTRFTEVSVLEPDDSHLLQAEVRYVVPEGIRCSARERLKLLVVNHNSSRVARLARLAETMLASGSVTNVSSSGVGRGGIDVLLPEACLVTFTQHEGITISICGALCLTLSNVRVWRNPSVRSTVVEGAS